MIELTFVIGGEICKFRIRGKLIEISSKNFGYRWTEWNPLGLSGEEVARLRAKKGEDWYKEYAKAKEEFENMETEEEISDDLIKDFQSKGWRLVKQEVKWGD
jgi:hypothetical protein